MKYILKIIYLSILMFFAFIIFGAKTIWDFKPDSLKEIWQEYRMAVAKQLYKGFKINIY